MMDMGPRFEVSIETWGSGIESVNEDGLGEFPHALEMFGGLGPAVSAGGLTGGIGATFGVELDYVDSTIGDMFAAVCHRGLGIFYEACDKVGFGRPEVAKVEVFTDAYLERELDEEPERYVGVAEVAEELKVSRQRVSELRLRPDFPTPVAELASGPVWALSSLRRFVAEWPRKPGRPRRRVVA
jgi:hypothetical protein